MSMIRKNQVITECRDMGYLYLITTMTEYLTQKEIIEKTGISESTYHSHKREILRSPHFSGYTEIKGVEYIKDNKNNQKPLYFHKDILNYFFHLKIKPKDKSDLKKYRSYVVSRKVDYTITITPQMTKKDNIEIMEIIRNDFRKTYGKELLTFEYNVECDKKTKYYHTHLLLGFVSETNLKEVKEHFTCYIEEKVGKSKIVEVTPYYGTNNNAGKWYFLKEGLVR